MQPSPTQLKQTYAQLSDKKLIQLATENSPNLRPEALALLKEEIKARGLSENILTAIEVQHQPVNKEKVASYVTLLGNLPCPICKDHSSKTEAALISQVFSVILFTVSKKELKFGCRNCLTSHIHKASISTVLFGWWGIPMGFISTPKALYSNFKMKDKVRASDSKDLLTAFVLQSLAKLEANKDNQEELQKMIAYVK